MEESNTSTNTNTPSLWPACAALLATLGGCSIIQDLAATSEHVTAQHGTYMCTADDGAHIYIPPGALPHDMEITIREVSAPAELDGHTIVGPLFDFGPDGTVFREPVYVQLHPGPMPLGVAMSDLSLFNLSGGQIEELTDVTVDEAAGTISGYTTHFSIFYTALAGPAGARGIEVGGRNLSPRFGGSTNSTPTEIPVWIAPGGAVSTNPYSGQSSDVLVIQVNTDPPVANTNFYIEGWTISPVDPGVVVGPTGDRISTRGFWHDLFAREIVNPLRNLRTDAQGRLALVIRGDRLYGQIAQAPAGYPSGRLRLRVFSPDGPDAVDAVIALGRTQ